MPPGAHARERTGEGRAKESRCRVRGLWMGWEDREGGSVEIRDDRKAIAACVRACVRVCVYACSNVRKRDACVDVVVGGREGI